MKITIGGKVVELEENQIKNEDGTLKSEISVDSDFIVRTKEEDETFKNNLRSEAKQTGVEVTIKEWRDKLGLDFQGKNMESFTEAFQKKVLEDAKIEPQKDIELLKGTIANLTKEKTDLESNFNRFKTDLAVKSELSQAIPENVILPQQDMITLISNKFEFDVNDSKVLVKKNGEVLKNSTTLEPLGVKDVLTSFFNENPQYLKVDNGGNGGQDSKVNNGTKQTLDKFIEEMQGKSIAINSDVFNKEYESRVKAGLIEA